MASKTTLNAKNLEALGVERLAELLIEISTGNANQKRRLRMELAGNSSGSELAHEVRKRLNSISRAQSWIGWRKIKSFKTDLESQRKMIVEKIAPVDPDEAFELIWQFLSLADSVFERSDDGNGTIISSFHAANEDAALIAKQAKVSPDRLAEKAFNALRDNSYGQYNNLIVSMVPALGEPGLRKLQHCFEDWLADSRDSRQSNSRSFTARTALQQIADALGDIDLYIVQHPLNTHVIPRVSTEIARRLLDGSRAEEALTVLDKAKFEGRRDVSADWQAIRADTLEALGRQDEAQQFRWQSFEQSLNEELLREFIRRLPDFDDMEAEEKAFAFVADYPDANRALLFFLRYPSLSEAAKLVLKRSSELSGDNYELMSHAAEKLADKYPLAATLVLRSMIDFTLGYSRTGRYKYAAQHLLECKTLDRHIIDYGILVNHDVYVANLRKQHVKKRAFWDLID